MTVAFATRRLVLAFVAAALTAAARPAPAPAAPMDLVPAFDRIATEVAALPPSARPLAAQSRLHALLPDFYPSADKLGPRRKAALAAALDSWPANRERILAADRRVRDAYAAGVVRFRRTFPGFRPTTPVYIVHSIGQMDGGTRMLDGKEVLMFGADQIASLHGARSIDPLVDHELFHTYHGRHFGGCEPVWCAVWIEGLATYVTHRLNPRATDEDLLLTYPRPIRADIDRRLRAAMCYTRARLERSDDEQVSPFVNGSDASGPYPPRFGYYVGYLVAERLARTRSLDQLARLPHARVRALLETTISHYGPCRDDEPL